MRIISLNTWGGRALHPLMHFLKDEAPRTDIFCLQEMHDTSREYRERRHPEEFVTWDLWERTRKRLPGHDGFLARWADNPDRMTVATFVRRTVPLGAVEMYTVHRPDDVHEEGSFVISPRKLIAVRIEVPGCPPLTVVNYHGMWRSTGKRDTPERIEESRVLAAYLKRIEGPLVLAGDLNLDPDTDAVALIAEEGKLKSLINPEIVKSTRTPLYRHAGDPRFSQYADYVFVRGITSYTFGVMGNHVPASDHAALMLELPWGGL